MEYLINIDVIDRKYIYMLNTDIFLTYLQQIGHQRINATSTTFTFIFHSEIVRPLLGRRTIMNT